MKKSEWFDLLHWLESISETSKECSEYDEYELQALKACAGFGEPAAAALLETIYESELEEGDGESEPSEELRWALINKFLEGDWRWAFYACDERFSHISTEMSDRIINEVRDWIREHPLAHSAVLSRSENKELTTYYIKDIPDGLSK